MSAREFAPSGAAPSPDEIAESSKRADRFAGASGGIDTFFSAVKRFGLRKAHATILAERGATDCQLMAVFCWESAREATKYTTVAHHKRLAADVVRLLETSEHEHQLSHHQLSHKVSHQKKSLN